MQVRMKEQFIQDCPEKNAHNLLHQNFATVMTASCAFYQYVPTLINNKTLKIILILHLNILCPVTSN